MIMRFNLIVPVAADKPEYANNMPYVFSTGNDGLMLCLKAIQGLNLEVFDNIYYTILRKHDEQFCLKAIFDIQFRRMGLEEKAKVVLLDEPTSSQPATVMATIEKENVEGALMVKDADSHFSCSITPNNLICTFPLDKLTLVNPQNKSYLTIDDGFFVTNIIEKRILGRYFCAGGYVFADGKDFVEHFQRLKGHQRLYMSHIVYSMLLDGKTFRPEICDDYQDWGTAESSKMFC